MSTVEMIRPYNTDEHGIARREDVEKTNTLGIY